MTSTPTIREVLEPCPFCGNEGDLKNRRGQWAVECVHCAASSGHYNESCEGKYHAVEAWNRRARTFLESIPADGGTVKARFAHLSERLRAIETLPKPGDLYYAVKNDGEGTGWSYVTSGVVASDIHDAAYCLSTPSDTAEAMGGPVGEASFWYADFMADGEYTRRFTNLETVADQWRGSGLVVTPLYARPAPKAQDEAERLTRERDDAVVRYASAVKDAAEQRALAERRRETICQYMNDDGRTGDAALAETRERLEKVLADAEQKARWDMEAAKRAGDHIEGIAKSHVIAALGEVRLLAALTGDAQEAGR